MSDTPAFPLAAHLGIAMDRSGEPGAARATCATDDRHGNPHGVVHGAVLFALADTAMGAATYDVMPPGHLCASIEVHLRFLSPAAVGSTLVADVRVVKAGKRVVHLDGRITADGALVATATGSFALFAVS